MKLSQSVTMLEVPGDFGTLYPILIEEGEDLLLVDTSYPDYGEDLLAAIRQEGYDPARIRTVLITHQDHDHIGGLPHLLKEAPEARILAHSLEIPYIDGSVTPIKLQEAKEAAEEGGAEEKAFYEDLFRDYTSSYTPVDAALEDGQLLPFAGGIRVLHTPGHTPGHACFFVVEPAILITGDAMGIEEGKLKGSSPIYTQDMAEAKRSEALLRAQPYKILTCFHGGYLEAEA